MGQAARKCDHYLCWLLSLSCSGSVSMDRDQDTGDVIHNSRRSAGGSLWSGLKQIFHNKSPGQPTPPEASINSRPRRLEHSSFSYSCLGNSNSRKVEDDMYGDSGSGMASQSSLSRNISYSHESVFQMDPPNNIPVSNLNISFLQTAIFNSDMEIQCFNKSQFTKLTIATSFICYCYLYNCAIPIYNNTSINQQ